MMESFIEKSRRRSSRRWHETAVKRLILIVLFGSIAAAITLSVMGLPR